MAASPPLVALRARWVFPVAGPPIADGVVTIGGSKIADVGPSVAGLEVRDLGNVAILPGLVNAHTHLEFSDLSVPLGKPGLALPDWIRLAVAHRRSGVAGGLTGTVAQGLRESLAAGTTALGEIATSDWRPKGPTSVTPQSKPSVCLFFELIAPVADRVAATIEMAEQFLQTHSPPHVAPALSPHAPYTVHPRLLEALVALARRYQVPLAMHLAESREELELLQSDAGPFRGLLEDLHAWDPTPDARYRRVLDYLQQLAQAPRALVIHGNYLTYAERQFLAARAETMTVVYCPRTHHYFRHAPYPLARMLSQGVAVAIGTDSRASNPDLSLFDEMRFVAEQHPEVDRATLLALGTSAGASALGLADQMGTLEPGKDANLAVVRLTEDNTSDPHELVFAPSTIVAQTWVRGECAHEN